MDKLDQAIEKIRDKENVDAAFLTGSFSAGLKPHSDIDLMIVLYENSEQLKMLATRIADIPADVLFFDHEDLERVMKAESLPADQKDARLVFWLNKAVVKFDKSGLLSETVKQIEDLKNKVFITQQEKERTWWKMNYDHLNNKRYFNSDDAYNHQALKLRFFSNGISDVVNGYFILRGSLEKPDLKGEKAALAYLKDYDPEFYRLLWDHIEVTELASKFQTYVQLADLAFTEKYPIWSEDRAEILMKDLSVNKERALVQYWHELLS